MLIAKGTKTKRFKPLVLINENPSKKIMYTTSRTHHYSTARFYYDGFTKTATKTFTKTKLFTHYT